MRDPAHMDGARRAATRNCLIGEQMGEATADAWLAAWAEQAARDGLEVAGTIGCYRLTPRDHNVKPASEAGSS